MHIIMHCLFLQTALQYAAFYGETVVVSFLLQEGANASLASEKGKTALEAVSLFL